MFFPDVHFLICCLCLMHDKSAAASFMWSQFYLISISSFLFFFFFFLSSLFLRSRLFLPALSALPFIDCIFCLLYNTYSAWNITSRGRHCATTLRLGRDFSRERERSRINAIRHAQLSLRRGINAPGDGCFDSRYWNSIDGEEILIISALRFRTPDGETGGKETCSKVKIIHEREAVAI